MASGRRAGYAWDFALVILFLVLLASSCSEPQIAAIGSNNEVVVITSPRCKEQGQAIKTILEKEIVTVQYENAFDVSLVTSGNVRSYTNRKCILLLDYLEPRNELAKKILDLAGNLKDDFASGTRNLLRLDDVWAKGQVVMIVTAPNRNDLTKFIESQSERIFAFVEDGVQSRLNRGIFFGGEEKAVTERLAKRYGWSLRLPTGYKVDERYASQRVIKILKDKPARMITVYWEDGRWDTSGSECLDRKRMLAWKFWEENEVVDTTTTVRDGTFLGEPCKVLVGTWQNRKYTIGGTFVTYCFTCSECGRHYVIDASVFAPGLAKMPLMRELKAILLTFRCTHRR